MFTKYLFLTTPIWPDKTVAQSENYMVQTENKSEHVSNQTDFSEDDIKLIDFLRVIWNWKQLIIGGTLICVIAAIIIS